MARLLQLSLVVYALVFNSSEVFLSLNLACLQLNNRVSFLVFFLLQLGRLLVKLRLLLVCPILFFLCLDDLGVQLFNALDLTGYGLLCRFLLLKELVVICPVV